MARKEPTEMCTFRLPISTVDHLDFAYDNSDYTKTVIVNRALREYLEKNHPMSPASGRALPAPAAASAEA